MQWLCFPLFTRLFMKFILYYSFSKNRFSLYFLLCWFQSVENSFTLVSRFCCSGKTCDQTRLRVLLQDCYFVQSCLEMFVLLFTAFFGVSLPIMRGKSDLTRGKNPRPQEATILPTLFPALIVSWLFGFFRLWKRP